MELLAKRLKDNEIVGTLRRSTVKWHPVFCQNPEIVDIWDLLPKIKITSLEEEGKEEDGEEDVGEEEGEEGEEKEEEAMTFYWLQGFKR